MRDKTMGKCDVVDMNTKIRDTVMRLFEEARQVKGVAYEPDRFLAYLTTPPVQRGRRCADTFRGRRRFVRFMNSVQLALGICFTNEEWERPYGLEEFVSLAEAKASKPEKALRLAENRLRESQVSRVDSIVKFGLLLAPLLIGAILSSQAVVRVLLGIGYVAAVGTIAWAAMREYSYSRNLVSRIRRGS